jgi:hypothetical protein
MEHSDSKVELVKTALQSPAPESDLKDLHEAVVAKVEGYDENADAQEGREFVGESIPWSRLFTPFASCGDYLTLFCAILLSIGMGAALPALSFFFGGSMDDMSSGSDETAVALLAPAVEKWIAAGGEVGDLSYTQAEWDAL